MLKTIYKYTLQPVVNIIYDRLIKPIFEIKDSPHSIALGLTVGLWISLTPTVGIQMTLSLIICTLLRANVLIAIAMCWISNPITFIPMYYGYYRFGLLVMGTQPTPWKDFKQMISNDYVIVAQLDPLESKKKKNIKDILKYLYKNKDKKKLLFNSQEQDNFIHLIKLCKEAQLPSITKWGKDISFICEISSNVQKLEKSLKNNKIPEDFKHLCEKENLKIILDKAKIKPLENGWIIEQNHKDWLHKIFGVFTKRKSIKLIKKDNKIIIYTLNVNSIDILKKLEKNKNYYGFLGMVNFLNYKRKLKTQKKSTNLKVIISDKREQTFWALCLVLLLMGFKEFGVPMWIGSLIIATVISIPAYPITYNAIKKFRESERIKNITQVTKKMVKKEFELIKKKIHIKDKHKNKEEINKNKEEINKNKEEINKNKEENN